MLFNIRPVGIRNTLQAAQLEIDWEDGRKSEFTHEFLRVKCPCADCTGHTPDQAKVIVGKEDVRITQIEQVGNYAVRIVFDDGHGSGIFTFDKLYQGME